MILDAWPFVKSLFKGFVESRVVGTVIRGQRRVIRSDSRFNHFGSHEMLSPDQWNAGKE